MAQALVHIGLPKTGSTTIQVFLKANRAALAAQGFAYLPPRLGRHAQIELALAAADRAGELIPDAIQRHRLGLTDLAAQRARVADFEAALDRSLAADRAAGRAPVRLFSCEQLSHALNSEALRAGLTGWLAARFDQVRYLMFLRDQPGFVLSCYSEGIKAGADQDLDAYIAGYADLDVRATALAWRDQLGERLMLRRMPGRGGPDLIDKEKMAMMRKTLKAVKDVRETVP